MAEEHSLILKVDSRQVKKAEGDLNGLSKAAGNTEKSTNKVSSAFASMSAILGTVGVAALAKEFVQIADKMNLLDARLKMVSSSTAEYVSQQKELLAISKNSYSSISEITSLYTKLNPALKLMGATTKDVNNITESFAKGLKIGGANAVEASSATLQFAQAMGSGVLRGEEFNAIAEASPKLMQYMADGMGVPVTALRKMAMEGELTSGKVSAALLKMSGQIKKDFGEIPVTVGMATENLKTDLSVAIAQFDKTTGATKALAETISGMSADLSGYAGSISQFYLETAKFIDEHNKALTTTASLVGGVAVAYYGFIAGGAVVAGVRAIATSVYTLRTAMIALQASSPILLAISVALGVATAAYLAHDDALEKKNYSTINSIESLTKAHDDLLKKRKEIQSDKFALDKTQKKETAIVDAELKKIEDRLNKIGQARSDNVKKIDKETQEAIKASKVLEENAKKLQPAKEKKVKKTDEQKAAEKEAEKVKGLEEELAKLKVENNSDTLKNMQLDDAKAYQEAILKREQQLEKFKGIKGAELEINKEFNNQVEKLNKDLIDKQKIIDYELFNIATKRQADIAVSIYEASLPESQKIIDKYTEIFEQIKDMPVEFIQTAVGQMNEELANIKFDSFKLEFDTQSLEGIPKAIAAVSKAMGNLEKADKEYNKKKKQYAEGSEGYALNEQEHLDNQIAGYSQMAGAMANMFESGSRESAAFQAVQSGLAVVNAVAAVMNAGTNGDGYTAVARMAVVAAYASQMLSQIGMALNGGGGGSAPTLPKSTVLGATAGTESESTTAIVDILSEAHASEYSELRDINRAVTSMAQGIESAVANIFKSGVLDTSSIGLSSSSNFQDRIDKTLSLLDKSVLNIGGIMSNAFLMSGAALLQKIGLGGSSKQYIAGSGFDIGGGTLGSKAGGNVGASTFVDVETASKNFWGSASYSHDIQRSALDTASSQSISLIYKSFSDTMNEINKGLGTSLAPAISNYTLSAIQISTAGLTGEQVIKTLNDRFSALGDKMANDIFGSILNQYQDLGEGLLETAVRVITEKAVVMSNLKDINKSIYGDTIAITQSLVDLSGGLSEFSDANASYYDKYFSNAEKQVKLQAKLSESFNYLGVSMPTTIEGFRKLVEGTDLSTLAGRELFTGLMGLSEGFAELKDNVKNTDLIGFLDDIKSFVSSLRAEIVPISITTSFTTFSKSFNDMIAAIASGSSDLSTIGTKAIDNARSYLDTVTATASAGRDIAFAKAVVANKFESVVIAPNITIGTVNDTLKYSLGEQSYIVSELRAMRQELITANQLGITQTANSINQLSATRALLPA